MKDILYYLTVDEHFDYRITLLYNEIYSSTLAHCYANEPPNQYVIVVSPFELKFIGHVVPNKINECLEKLQQTTQELFKNTVYANQCTKSAVLYPHQFDLKIIKNKQQDASKYGGYFCDSSGLLWIYALTHWILENYKNSINRPLYPCDLHFFSYPFPVLVESEQKHHLVTFLSTEEGVNLIPKQAALHFDFLKGSYLSCQHLSFPGRGPLCSNYHEVAQNMLDTHILSKGLDTDSLAMILGRKELSPEITTNASEFSDEGPLVVSAAHSMPNKSYQSIIYTSLPFFAEHSRDLNQPTQVKSKKRPFAFSGRATSNKEQKKDEILCAVDEEVLERYNPANASHIKSLESWLRFKYIPSNLLYKKHDDGLRIVPIAALLDDREHCYGVVATRDFMPNQIIGEYLGKKVTLAEYEHNFNIFQIDEQYGILNDGQGNWTAFMNTTAEAKTANIVAEFNENKFSIQCKVVKKISEGEQLLVWYGDEWANHYKTTSKKTIKPLTPKNNHLNTAEIYKKYSDFYSDIDDAHIVQASENAMTHSREDLALNEESLKLRKVHIPRFLAARGMLGDEQPTNYSYRFYLKTIPADLTRVLGFDDSCSMLIPKLFDNTKSSRLKLLPGAKDYLELPCLISKKGEFLLQHEQDNLTCLMLASWQGNIDLIDLLLDNGADPNTKGTLHGYTALHLLMLNPALDESSKIEVIELFGTHPKTSWYAQDRYDKTLAHYAILKNQNKLLELFLKYDEVKKTQDEPSILDCMNSDEDNLLTFACKCGSNIAVIEQLINVYDRELIEETLSIINKTALPKNKQEKNNFLAAYAAILKKLYNAEAIKGLLASKKIELPIQMESKLKLLETFSDVIVSSKLSRAVKDTMSKDLYKQIIGNNPTSTTAIRNR